ncbi:MAG: DUF1573 domain-containing protein [Gemmatimonadaceae bacterium]
MAICGICGAYAGRHLFSSKKPIGPIIHYANTVEIGDRERGEQVNADFRISNDGDSDLVLDQISTNCVCMGVERKSADGSYVRVRSGSIPPGSRANLVLRFRVAGPAGGPVKAVVKFLTNDQNKPQGHIEFGD